MFVIQIMNGSLAEKAFWHRTINHSRTPNLKRITAQVIHQSTHIFSDFFTKERSKASNSRIGTSCMYVQLQTDIRYVRQENGHASSCKLSRFCLLQHKWYLIQFSFVITETYLTFFKLNQDTCAGPLIVNALQGIPAWSVKTPFVKSKLFHDYDQPCERDSTETWYSNQ